MDESKSAKISVPAVVVLYDFHYTAKDKREISMRKGEKLYLIEKTNKDWWQVIRQSERRSFYVPAQYVEVISKEKLPLEHLNLSSESRAKEKVEYENINVKHRDNIPFSKQNSAIDSNNRVENDTVKSAQFSKQKPVPKTRTKVSSGKGNYDCSPVCKTGQSDSRTGNESEKCDRPKYGGKSVESGSSQPKSSDRFTHPPEEKGECERTNFAARGRNTPKTRSRISGTINENDQIDNKNRMRSSYNLRVKPSKSFEVHQKSPGKPAKEESMPMLKGDNRNLSRSLEKLAQEIKFQPKEIDAGEKSVPALTHHIGSDVSCGKGKNKAKEYSINNLNNNNNNEKKERVQKGDEQSFQPHSKGSVFTRLRRSLHHSSSFKSNNFKKLNKNNSKACELSLSWEGGLDKALELEMKKPQVTPAGLQRSRTFMVAERSPTIFRHPSSIYQGRNRVDIAYHSQKRPEMKNVLSTFKPIGKIDEVKRRVAKHSRDDSKRLEVVERGKDVGKEDGGMLEKGKTKETERYSHSESEDDPKSFPSAADIQKKSRDRSSIDSNLTHSEGTELSESDENGSLDLEKATRGREPLNKRRTSLMRNRRVSTAKSRTVTARQLPPTPTPEDLSTKDLGNGWGVYVFDDKRNYYYNRLTGEKSWKPPRRNLSRQDNRYVGSGESICSDTSGSIIRSSTSSPSNERALSNSLNRSNASLSSRSTGCDNSGCDLTKSSSGCNLREESTRNRSSLTSSPATGQSRSSSYSVIKSSRDSLNRCSPIENIPYEEDDDIELRDHVYRKGVAEELSEAVSEEESKPEMNNTKEDLLDDDDDDGDEDEDDDDNDGRPATGVPVPPGWTECYDEATSQFYYIHKDTKQKETNPCSDEDLFREILTKIDNDISELEERMTASEEKSNSFDVDMVVDRNRRHSLPPNFVSPLNADVYVTTVKPPIPPGKRKTKVVSRSKSLNRRNRSFRKQFVTLVHVLQAIDESNCRRQQESMAQSGDDDLEYEPQELLMLQRVTDSLKERRKLSNERKALDGKQKEILKELDKELKSIADERGVKIREDVIIDWENDYDNLSEPVVLEGKSISKRSCVEEVRQAEKSVRFAEVSPCRDPETEEVEGRAAAFWEEYHSPDKISVSSMSDYEDTLTTYSDIESDLIEAIHLGESWCNEVCGDEETDAPDREGFLNAEPIIAESNALPRKSWSCSNLINAVEPLVRWKSLDFFRDSLAEERILARVSSTDSIASDVVEWLARVRGVVYVEDKLLSSDDREEWFTSFDPEGRLYFFDEQSNESSWALPVISTDGNESKYIIQRSATESAIPKSSAIAEDGGDKRRSRVSSTRSSKTQSMVIEPKLEFPGKEDGKTLSMPRDLTKIYGEILRSGMLNKTKICENGKKVRKNWTPAFVVLSNTKLMFFKDAKTFHSMKPGNDCMCLNLQGAVIEKGDKISSKKNVYRINSVDHTEVLIQTDRTADAEEWFKDISNVIQSLPQESIDSSTSSLDPNSPSKVGRTKSVKARSKDGGSMEDLSLNPEERQNKIKAKLKKFFNRRPTVDSLKKKGIWKDEPVFGCSLEQTTKNRIPRVPVFVEKCIECIESKEENLKTDGLYRASGNLSQVQKIRLEVDQNNLNILKEEEDVHVLTGSLKLFFRELKDPLIPFKQLVPALTAINNPKRKEKIREYRKIVGSLPGPNYDTLKFLLLHLLKVEKYNEFNRMNVNNLAIVFGPTLMWPEQESANMALDFMQQNLVIECLLREFQEIFT